MSVHPHFFKERKYISMKPFNLLLKLSYDNVIDFKSKAGGVRHEIRPIRMRHL